MEFIQPFILKGGKRYRAKTLNKILKEKKVLKMFFYFTSTTAIVRDIMNNPLTHKAQSYKFLLTYNKNGKSETVIATLTTPYIVNPTTAKAVIKWRCKESGIEVTNIFCIYNKTQKPKLRKLRLDSIPYCRVDIPHVYNGELKELGVLDSYTQKCLALIVREQSLSVLSK